MRWWRYGVDQHDVRFGQDHGHTITQVFESELRAQGRGRISGTDTGSIAATVQLAEGLSACIAGYDQRIEELASKKYGHTKMLRQVKGVGPITELAYVLTLESPERFRQESGSRLVPYLGLLPGKRTPEKASHNWESAKPGTR